MAKDSIPPPNLHGIYRIQKSSQVFPGGRTLALILSTVVFVLVFSAYYPVQIFYDSPKHTSHQAAITSQDDSGTDCNLFNGTWVKDFVGPTYNNITCPTMPESKNCGKYGKQMDYVNWRWMPQGCDMARFEPQLFLDIVRGKTLAFAGDSIGRNQMESLLCLLSQVEVPMKVHSDTADKFITWHFRSHNFTLMALWTKFMSSISWLYLVHVYEDGKLIGCIYCSEDNITSFSVLSRVFKTALSNLNRHREPRLQLTVVRTATPAHFENGSWDTGGSCNRTEPVGEGKAMTSTIEWAIRNIQVEEVNRAQKEKKHKGGMKIEILDISKAMSMRPDAHPGIHWNNQWMRGYSDCSHWCLPGPIDMWNA